MATITCDQLSLTFRTRVRGSQTLKDLALNFFTRRPREPEPEVRALEDVSFEVNEGERLGILGPNGAGKSSLLRTLAGIYRPTSGTCQVQGKVCSLFNIALGFEPDASGWQNILYRGYLQRETPQSIRAKMQEIADFSELGDALDRPVRHYSSGMLVRLAFSIATSIEPEILLVDEVLSAGDLAFTEKARQRIHQLIRKARILVMVSHDLKAFTDFCDRAIWLDHGRIQADGAVDEVVAAYQGRTATGCRQLAAC